MSMVKSGLMHLPGHSGVGSGIISFWDLSIAFIGWQFPTISFVVFGVEQNVLDV